MSGLIQLAKAHTSLPLDKSALDAAVGNLQVEQSLSVEDEVVGPCLAGQVGRILSQIPAAT
jgi:hypothetical protein